MDIVAIIFGLIPGFAWLFFYLKEDPHPEPKSLIAITFILGIISAIVALVVQVVLNAGFPILGITKFSLLAILILALVEEVCKFGAAYFATRNNENFDEPVDAMVYIVIAALGFATLENLGAVGGFSTLPSQFASISDIFHVSSMRFVGATLLHSLASALVGYYWARSIRELGNWKFIVFGLLIATGLHAIFNYLIIVSESLYYSLSLVFIVGFFVLNDFEKLKQKAI